MKFQWNENSMTFQWNEILMKDKIKWLMRNGQISIILKVKYQANDLYTNYNTNKVSLIIKISQENELSKFH